MREKVRLEHDEVLWMAYKRESAEKEEVGRERSEQLQRETSGQTQVCPQHCQVDTSDI